MYSLGYHSIAMALWTCSVNTNIRQQTTLVTNGCGLGNSVSHHSKHFPSLLMICRLRYTNFFFFCGSVNLHDDSSEVAALCLWLGHSGVELIFDPLSFSLTAG